MREAWRQTIAAPRAAERAGGEHHGVAIRPDTGPRAYGRQVSLCGAPTRGPHPGGGQHDVRGVPAQPRPAAGSRVPEPVRLDSHCCPAQTA